MEGHFQVRVGNAKLDDVSFPLYTDLMAHQTKKQIKYKDCLFGPSFGLPILVKSLGFRSYHNDIGKIKVTWDSSIPALNEDTCLKCSMLSSSFVLVTDLGYLFNPLMDTTWNEDGIFMMINKSSLFYEFSSYYHPDTYTLWLFLGSVYDGSGHFIGIESGLKI